MINVKSKRCDYIGCDSIPVFNIKGGKGRFCVKHKTDKMIDVKHKLCENPDCTVRASYGKPGSQISHCAQHRQPGMIRRPNGKCKSKSCHEPAIYGTNYIPRHCETHRQEGEQNLVERECVKCHLTMILNASDNCEYCDPATFETARLAKQNALMDYLDSRKDLPKVTSTDITIDHGICGKERPDRIYDMDNKIVILECDERQHNDRACVCEQTRMANIGQSFGGMPVYFIRWNPDDYSPENDKKEPELLAKRHKLCGDLIRDIYKNKVELPKDALVSAIYLYYDGWDNLSMEPWRTVVALEKV
jgi:hypothetical protein